MSFVSWKIGRLDLANLNFARLNHVLIPATKEGRDAQRDRPIVRVLLAPIGRLYFALTDVGRGLFGLAFIAGLMGLDVLRGQNYYAAAALWTLLLGSLSARRALTPFGLSVEVHAPARAMAGEPIPFRIVLRSDGDAPLEALRLRRPFLPWDGRWRGGERCLARLLPGAHAEIVTEATFVARGRHHIDTFGVAATLPLGLATGPEVESRGTRFIVWPRPLHVAGLDFESATRESARQSPRARTGGVSLELLGLRPYRPGDSVRDLHAASWARIGEPVVRAYQAEERARVAIVLDPDGSNEERLEGAVSVAAGLLIEAAEAGSEILLVVLDDDHPTPVVLGRGRGAVDAGLDVLACLRGRKTPLDATALARHAQALGDGTRILFATAADEEAGLAQAAGLARSASPLAVFVLEPRPRRFGPAHRRDPSAEGRAPDPRCEVRRIAYAIWSGQRAERRRPRS